jgi:hypothetical protein
VDVTAVKSFLTGLQQAIVARLTETAGRSVAMNGRVPKAGAG